MKVLVTGASGFIGRHVLSLLAENGWEVHAIGSATPAVDLAKLACWHRVNLFDHALTAATTQSIAASHLLHLAWFTQPGAYWTAAVNVDWVAASLTLLLAFQRAHGRRAVIAGTCAEYDWSSGLLREESTPCLPASVYGQSKLYLLRLGEALARSASINLASGRVFYLYGPGEGQQRLVPSVIRALLAGERAQCSKGTQRRDFLHVHDVASAFVAMLESEVSGPVNIGSGEAVPVRAVVEAIARQMGQSDRVDFGVRPLPASEPELICADNTKLVSTTGWRRRFSLEEGIAHTIEWWRTTKP